MKNSGYTKNKATILVMTALFAALVCIGTMIIHIPSGPNGYVNFGDCFVLLSGWVLPPMYGTLAGGIGSMIADLLSGYAFYAPATFVIKALVALCACLLFKPLSKALSSHRLIARIISALCAETIMVFGYFAYSALILGNGLSAALSIPGDVFQGIAAVISSTILITVIDKYHLSEKLFKG